MMFLKFVIMLFAIALVAGFYNNWLKAVAKAFRRTDNDT